MHECKPLRDGDAIAVHNALGWTLASAEVVIMLAAGLDVVDSRTGEVLPRQQVTQRESLFAVEVVVVVPRVPPLGRGLHSTTRPAQREHLM